MKRVLGVLLAVFIGVGAFVGIANAQERKPVTITAQKACGVVTLTFFNPNPEAASVHGFRWNAVAGKVATGDGARTGLVTVRPTKTVKETITFKEDEFDGEAAVTVGYAFGPNSDIQPIFPDVYPVDTDCGAVVVPPATTTTVPPPPPATTTTVPPPPPTTTTTVPPPPVVVPPVDELDCADFNSQAAAQAKFEEDLNDPHNLDANNNGLACEFFFDTGVEETPVTPPQVIQIPVGGVATGDGSSL
jgi:hypothetical protein